MNAVRGVALGMTLAALSSPVMAADTYALIVSGASGGAAYAAKYDGWRMTLVTTLESTFGYDKDHVVSLGEASKDHVLRAFRDLRSRVMTDDVLFVALIGHGAGEKFNLVGPDMSAADWAVQLTSIHGRIVFVDMASSSFAFLGRVAAPGRIVIAAAESTAQQFETVFPEFFVKAFTDASADVDKDGRVSMSEAFSYANARVRAWFDQHNQLPTEHALMDDSAGLAPATFLQPRAAAADETAARRQAELEAAIGRLKAQRLSMPAAAYDAELERLLTELAQLAAQSRRR